MRTGRLRSVRPVLWAGWGVLAVGAVLCAIGWYGVSGERFAARQITRRLDGAPVEPRFEYVDKGSMATISRFSAVASIGRLRFSGFFAWVLWLAIHLVYIIGFKHRVTTLLHWACLLYTSDAADD